MNFFQSLTTIKNYQRFAFAAPFIIFILMIFGSYVKALGAGLACPDWPLCHGQLIPLYITGDPVAWVYMEYIHRLIALIVSFLIFSIFLCSYKFLKEAPRLFWITSTIALLLVIQILLGGLTIDTRLNAIVVTTHFTVATIIFGLSIVNTMFTFNDLSALKIQETLQTTNTLKEKAKTTRIDPQ